MTSQDIRRILLAVDGSVHADKAAEYLIHYATALGRSETIVLHVLEAETFAERATGVGDTVTELTELGMNATRRTRRILDAASVFYRFETKLGQPADVIAEAVATERADEVVMGSRGMSQWQGLFVGSVAYKVIHQVSVPITIVGTPRQEANLGPSKPSDVHRVLLATDGSAHSARATEYICDLQKAGVPLEVHLLNVALPVPPGYVRRFLSQDMIDSYYQEEGARALHDAKAALASAAVKFDEDIVAGHAAEKIVQIADDRKCSRIVMGTRGLGAAAGIVLGSVAYRVVHLSPLPVTLVK